MAQGGRGAGGGVRVRGGAGVLTSADKSGGQQRGCGRPGAGAALGLASPHNAALCAAVPQPHRPGTKAGPGGCPSPNRCPPAAPQGRGLFVLPGSQLSLCSRPTSPCGSGPASSRWALGGATSPPRWPRCFVCREAPLQPLTSQATRSAQGWPSWGLVEQGCWLWWWDQVGGPQGCSWAPSADAVFLPRLGNLLSCRNLLPSISASSRWCRLCHRAAAARQGTGKSPGVSRSGCAVLALQRRLGNSGAEPSGVLDVSWGGTVGTGGPGGPWWQPELGTGTSTMDGVAAASAGGGSSDAHSWGHNAGGDWGPKEGTGGYSAVRRWQCGGSVVAAAWAAPWWPRLRAACGAASPCLCIVSSPRWARPHLCP